MDTEDLLQDWSNHLRVEKNHTPRSIQESLRHVRSTLELVEKNHPDLTDLSEVTRPRLVSALSQWRSAPDRRFTAHDDAPRERSASTINRRHASLRSFFDWCVEEEHISRSPAARLRGVKLPPASSPALGEDIVRKVMHQAASSRLPQRDTLLVALFATCGLTLSEVVDLSIDDLVGTPPQRLLVRSRSLHQRTVDLSRTAQVALEAYLPVRSALLSRHGAASSALFLSGRPRTDPQGTAHLEATPAAVSRSMERLLRQCKVTPSGASTHALRASFASLALASGSYTVGEVSHALGSDVAALKRLVHVPGEAPASSRRHPLDP